MKNKIHVHQFFTLPTPRSQMVPLPLDAYGVSTSAPLLQTSTLTTVYNNAEFKCIAFAHVSLCYQTVGLGAVAVSCIKKNEYSTEILFITLTHKYASHVTVLVSMSIIMPQSS